MGLTAAAEWVIGRLLNKGVVAGQSIGTGANYDLIGSEGDGTLYIGNRTTLQISVDMTGAAGGDLGVQLNPLEADGVTVMPIALTPVVAVGPTLNGGHVYYSAQFDVTAYERVRARITNNNAGTQTITRASWNLS